MLKAVFGTIVLLGILAGSATAATFNIAFTENGLGDDEPDWFGTFEAPTSGGLLTSFSATIDGVLYDRITFGTFPQAAPQYDSVTNTIFGNLSGVFGAVGSGADTDLNAPAIIMVTEWFGTPNTWFDGNRCDVVGCGGGGVAGTYTITAVSPVPIPAALPLLLSALGFFGFFGWRRKAAVT